MPAAQQNKTQAPAPVVMPPGVAAAPQAESPQAPPPPWSGAPTGVHQQSTLDENNALLKEVHKMVKHIRLMQGVKLALTVVFLVIPIIAAVVVLPRFITNTVGNVSELTGELFGVEGNFGEILKFYSDLGSGEITLDQIDLTEESTQTRTE